MGSCEELERCSFSGMLTVDVTDGVAKGADITFPGLKASDVLVAFGSDIFGVSVTVLNGPHGVPPFPDSLILSFTTRPTSGSLVGFSGGSIVGIAVDNAARDRLYSDLRGNIIGPEPGTLEGLLLGTGVIGLAWVTRRKLSSERKSRSSWKRSNE